MAPRTTDTAEDEFDLTRFLWGDLPRLAEHPAAGENGRTPDLPASASAFPASGEDRLLTETVALRESSPAWEAANPVSSETERSDPIDAEDAASEFDADADIDLDALAALAELAETGFNDDDPTTEASGDEPDEPPRDTRSLSYGELTERLHKEVLPRLRTLAESKGYLTLGHLARAVLELQDSKVHLDDVRAFVELIDVPLLPSRSHQIGRKFPLWAIRQAQRLFGDMLRDQIDEQVVIKRFGYVGVPLSQGTRDFLVQAWMCHYLSRAEERALVSTVAAEVARVGEDPGNWSAEAFSAREALVLDNLWLVARMARHYMGQGVEIDDLLQFGVLGLFRAVEKYDPGRVDRFVKYANNWVFQSITRHIADHSRLIRLPVHAHHRGKAIADAQAQFRQIHERDPTLAEIAEASDTSEIIVRALLVTTRPVSLDDPRGQAAMTRLAESEDPGEKAEAGALADSIRAALAGLTEPQREVLEQRFGLRDGRVRTLEEVGRARGVTRERIRQIESRALERLRHPSRANMLKDYVASPQLDKTSADWAAHFFGESRSVESDAVASFTLQFEYDAYDVASHDGTGQTDREQSPGAMAQDSNTSQNVPLPEPDSASTVADAAADKPNSGTADELKESAEVHRRAREQAIDSDRIREVLPQLPLAEQQIVSTLWALNGGRPRTIPEVSQLFKLPEADVEELSRRIIALCNETDDLDGPPSDSQQPAQVAQTDDHQPRQQTSSLLPAKTSLLDRLKQRLQPVRRHVSD